MLQIISGTNPIFEESHGSNLEMVVLEGEQKHHFHRREIASKMGKNLEIASGLQRSFGGRGGFWWGFIMYI